jgi:hypothetical protein
MRHHHHCYYAVYLGGGPHFGMHVFRVSSSFFFVLCDLVQHSSAFFFSSLFCLQVNANCMHDLGSSHSLCLLPTNTVVSLLLLLSARARTHDPVFSLLLLLPPPPLLLLQPAAPFIHSIPDLSRCQTNQTTLLSKMISPPMHATSLKFVQQTNRRTK